MGRSFLFPDPRLPFKRIPLRRRHRDAPQRGPRSILTGKRVRDSSQSGEPYPSYKRRCNLTSDIFLSQRHQHVYIRLWQFFFSKNYWRFPAKKTPTNVFPLSSPLTPPASPSPAWPPPAACPAPATPSALRPPPGQGRRGSTRPSTCRIWKRPGSEQGEINRNNRIVVKKYKSMRTGDTKR